MNTTTGRMSSFIIFALIGTLTFYKAGTVTVTEGEVAKLHFSYPCNSTRITLQYDGQAPFYSSANPEYMSSNQKFKVENGTDDCTIQLIINSAIRDDAGSYILIAYKNDLPITDTPRSTSLHVIFPPGNASCELGEYHLDREWVSFQCTALLGSQPGQIDCYQNSVRLPNRNELIETDVNLKQIILARPDSVVYCCSSILGAVKDECECADWGWNPVSNGILDVPVPCPEVSTQYPEINGGKTTSNSTNILKSNCPNDKTCQKIYTLGFIIVFATMLPIFVCLVIKRYIKRKSQSNKMKQLLKLYEFKKKKRRILTSNRGPQSENRESRLPSQNEDESPL